MIPEFCDINKYNFNLNGKHLEKLINDDVLAVICVHLFGLPENIIKINSIIKKKKDISN